MRQGPRIPTASVATAVLGALLVGLVALTEITRNADESAESRWGSAVDTAVAGIRRVVLVVGGPSGTDQDPMLSEAAAEGMREALERRGLVHAVAVREQRGIQVLEIVRLSQRDRLEARIRHLMPDATIFVELREFEILSLQPHAAGGFSRATFSFDGNVCLRHAELTHSWDVSGTSNRGFAPGRLPPEESMAAPFLARLLGRELFADLEPVHAVIRPR